MSGQNGYKKYLYAALTAGTLGFITLVIMMSSPLNPLCAGATGTDSSVFKYVALVMSKGGMPYKDAFDHKGPLLYILNYLGLLISYYRGLWVIECGFMFAFLAVTHLTARLFCGRLLSSLLVILCASPLGTYLESGNLTEEYALVFTAIGMYIFLDYFLNSRISKLRLVVCGACLAAVLMLRVNLAAIWVVFPVAVLIKCVREKSSTWISFLLWFIVGMAIVIVPIFLWLILNGAFGDFVNDYIVFNLKYSSDETRTTILNRYNSFTYFLGNNLLLGAIVINGGMILKEKGNRILNSAHLTGIFVSLLAMAISGQKYGHYGITIVPLLIYPYSWLFGSFIKEVDTRKLFIVFFLVVFAFSPWKKLGRSVASRAKNYIAKKDVFSQEQKKVVALIKKKTEEDEKIIALGNQDIWYVLSKRLAASKYSYQSPIARIDEEIKEEFLADMEATSPKLVVLVKGFEEFFARIDDYDCIYENEDKNGKIRVYLLPSAKD